MLTRRPAPRPYDVIALEVILSLASAVQVSLLLWLGLGTWDDRGLTGGPVVGVLVVLAFAVAIGWFLWLMGRGGWLLAGAMFVSGIEAGLLWLLGLSSSAAGVSPSALLLMVLIAILGTVCGVFLPAPSARRYRPEPRVRPDAGNAAPAKVTPSVARAADKYAKPVVVTASAVAAAGAQKVSRSSAPTEGRVLSSTAVDPEPVIQPRAGTPIKTSGPVSPDAATPATGTSPVSVSGSPGSPATRPASTGTTGRPDAAAAPAPATRPASSTSAAPADPGAIARSGRATIDAQLAPPPPKPTPSGTPGFRLVEPAKPVARPPAPAGDVRVAPAGSMAPRSSGLPPLSAQSAPAVGDPRSVQPSIVSVTPPTTPPVPRPQAMPAPSDAAGHAPAPGQAPSADSLGGFPILGDPGDQP
ncbi:MAG: hypothetical protein U0869_20980 [Chloroflexota bacterium]